MPEETESPAPYKDDDLVYVDVKGKKVVSLVEWLPSGKPKQIEVMFTEPEIKKDDQPDRPKRVRKKRYYPWCSYKTAKKVYHVEGKFIDKHGNAEFDETLTKALSEPYWD